jgi:hypothetical protein
MADQPVLLPEWVRKNDKSEASGITRVFSILMVKRNLTYKDILDLPIPAIFCLLEDIEKEAKEEERQMKKSKRK